MPVSTATVPGVGYFPPELELLCSTVAVVVNGHVNDADLCAVRGSLAVRTHAGRRAQLGGPVTVLALVGRATVVPEPVVRPTLLAPREHVLTTLQQLVYGCVRVGPADLPESGERLARGLSPCEARGVNPGARGSLKETRPMRSLPRRDARIGHS